MDGRLEGRNNRTGKPLTDPHIMGVLQGDEYNFAVEKFNIEDTFRFLEQIKIDLKPWNNIWYLDLSEMIFQDSEDSSSV